MFNVSLAKAIFFKKTISIHEILSYCAKTCISKSFDGDILITDMFLHTIITAFVNACCDNNNDKYFNLDISDFILVPYTSEFCYMLKNFYENCIVFLNSTKIFF